MTGDQREALKEAAIAATQGEWRQGSVEKYHVFVECREHGCLGTERVLLRMNTHFDHIADAAYIAAASPSTVLALIERCEKAEALLCPRCKAKCPHLCMTPPTDDDILEMRAERDAALQRCERAEREVKEIRERLRVEFSAGAEYQRLWAVTTTERDAARSEVERMRPVYEACETGVGVLRDIIARFPSTGSCWFVDASATERVTLRVEQVRRLERLRDAIDTARAAKEG